MKKCITIIVLFWSCITLGQEFSFLVKPYLQQATPTSIKILWETTAPANAKVYYGKATAHADKPNISKVQEDSRYLNFHEVQLSNLEPDTNYFWKVVSTTAAGITFESKIYTFKTNIKPNGAFMFAVVGDSQRGKDSTVWRRIAKKVWENRPNFVVHLGDLVDNGLEKKDWTTQFLPEGHPLMSRIPMYTALGNHEQNAEYYYQYMANPAPEYYYTFTYGNTQFFVIDTNKEVTKDSEQYNWLEWELAKSKATWKVVMHHHPPYTSEENDNGDTYKELSTNGVVEIRDLTGLYEKYGVDFCLYGHVHMYERTWPLKNNTIDQKNGVVYINSGGAGGSLEGFAPTRTWFSLAQRSTHHYCTFAIHDKTVVFKAIDIEGRLFDTFQFTKNKGKLVVKQPPAPMFNNNLPHFYKNTEVSLRKAFDNLKIYYTKDGSTPTTASKLYKNPITIKKNTQIKAISVSPKGAISRVVSKSFFKAEKLKRTTSLDNLRKGLSYKYYEGKWKKLPNFKKLKPKSKGILKSFTLQNINKRKEYWGASVEGYAYFSETKLYQFYTTSDDGSQLFIDDKLIVDNDGSHARKRKTGGVFLEAGYHKVTLNYFNGSYSHSLKVGMLENLEEVSFFPSNLFHKY